MVRRNYQLLIVLVITVIILACVPSIGLNPAQAPTFDPNSLNTTIAQTANAAIMQTAFFITPSATATYTPTATDTPTITPSITPTILILIPTLPQITPIPAVGSSGKKYECGILAKSPVDGFGYSAGVDFTTTWALLNIGTESWLSANTNVLYSSGDKLHSVSAGYDLNSDIPSGEQVQINVPMRAPSQGGTYTTTWVITDGTDEYCRMSISITVI